jgi:hypothetical protein
MALKVPTRRASKRAFNGVLRSVNLTNIAKSLHLRRKTGQVGFLIVVVIG